jgi:hypothetical protein
MGCCCLAAIGSFFPRLALLLMWLFTDYVDRAFSGFLLPLLGLMFLPFTTIMFCLVYSPAAHGVVGADWMWVFLGLFLDFVSYGSGDRGRRRRSGASTA